MQQLSKDQRQPLLSEGAFDGRLVTGVTQIERNGELDYIIDHPGDMSGYVISLTVAGEGEIFSGNRALKVGKGDIILLPPDAEHHYRRTPDSAYWHHRWIYFRPREHWRPWLHWSKKHGLAGYLNIISDQSFKRLESLFVEVKEAMNSSRLLAEELAMNLVEQLLIRCAEFDPVHEEALIDHRISAACRFIRQNLTEPVKTGAIAEHVGLSVSRLTHLFTEQLGMSISRWREQQRMDQAKQLLLTTGLPICHVARKVGYPDQLYFSKVFRRSTGLSPSLYRESRVKSSGP